MTYITVDNAVTRILKLGKDALLAKVDIEHAYRNVPVHCEDRHLLGMSWHGTVYIDSDHLASDLPRRYSRQLQMPWNGYCFSMVYLCRYIT